MKHYGLLPRVCCTLLLVIAAVPQFTLAETPEPAPAALPEAAIWDPLAQLKFPRDARVGFRETRSSRMLRRPAVASGELWITTDGAFVMAVNKPRTEERRLANDRLTLKRGKRERSTTLKHGRAEHQLLLSVVDILDGNIDTLRERFSATAIDTTTPGWTLQLVPRDERLRQDLAKLVLRGEHASLLSLRAERANAQSWQQIEILSTVQD